MCIDEVAAMYPYRIPGILAGVISGSAFTLTAAELEALLLSLPTTLPSEPGVLWNNGNSFASS